jgi:hypothetical protein
MTSVTPTRTLTALLAAALAHGCLSAPASPPHESGPRTGRVRVQDRVLVDDNGPFLGLGVSYFTALHRCRHDRPRLEADLGFLAEQGYLYYRMLSMVGYYTAWDGLEIAPVDFTNRAGKAVDAWPDYWEQLATLVDIAYDRYGLRAQITIFDKQVRIEHMRRLLSEVVPGREHKIILLEVANEAWQNGFPGDQGVADLREFATFLAHRTEIPVAISSNHDWPELGSKKGFDQVYAGSAADIATWHFSRDRRTDDGWRPVYDCWDLAQRPGCPPVSSNEPIGPGASVNTEHDPLRLVMAAAFAYTAGLPMYVFHSEAGVFGRTRFEDTPAIGRLKRVLELLPADLPNWKRNDGAESGAVFTAFAGGRPDRFWTEAEPTSDGCLRNTGARKGDRFVCVPIGIQQQGLTLEARFPLRFTVHHPVSGAVLLKAALERGQPQKLPAGPGALLVIGEVLADGETE